MYLHLKDQSASFCSYRKCFIIIIFKCSHNAVFKPWWLDFHFESLSLGVAKRTTGTTYDLYFLMWNMKLDAEDLYILISFIFQLSVNHYLHLQIVLWRSKGIFWYRLLKAPPKVWFWMFDFHLKIQSYWSKNFVGICLNKNVYYTKKIGGHHHEVILSITA